LQTPEARVVSLGGGTLTQRDLRHQLLTRGLVVTLEATTDALMQRLGDVQASRPNLRGPDLRARIDSLRTLRAGDYAEAHASIDTTDRSADEVCDLIERLAANAPPLVMPLGERSYRIAQTVGSPEVLTDCLAELAPSHLIVVTDSNVIRARGAYLDRALGHLAIESTRITLPPGELHKNLGSVGLIWDAALGVGIDRNAVVLAFGGGVVGDLAGFAASTLLRGVRFVQAPTTLLSMVDSSVGGKTGFDHTAGKNLVGSFHQPCAVVIDTEHLMTLAPRELRAGAVEMIKQGLIDDASLFEALETSPELIAECMYRGLAPVISQAVAGKIRIVAADEREQGVRALLNLGHTIGHALESATGYRTWLHGEAVGLGLLAEMRFGLAQGLSPEAPIERVQTLLSKLGLPISIPDATRLRAAGHLRADKKRSGDHVRLPLCQTVGRSDLHRVSIKSLESALRGT
jgi:shikimate kinase/3-dehydroquinate synthase